MIIKRKKTKQVRELEHFDPIPAASFEPEAGTIGYIFRTHPAGGSWSYIGQSTRLDRAAIDEYFGSGAFMKDTLRDEGAARLGGPAGLQKMILATAQYPLELHYLEMLHIAAAKRDGLRLGNGDFGGPRPFPNMQRALWGVLPEAMEVADNPARFFDVLVKERDRVEQAILDAKNVPVDEFYAGLERDLRATQDLSHPCPSCGADGGEVCRTNSKSLSKPRNPSANHAKRPRS